MSNYTQARGIYKAICNNPSAIAKKRAEYLALADLITHADGGGKVTSSTVNGQSFAMSHGKATRADDFRVLELVCGMLDAGTAGSKTTIAVFL